jgi:hypothetical protein
LIRERRRVAKILLVLALVFAFCWLPYSVLNLIMDMYDKEPPAPDAEPGDTNSGSDVDEQLLHITSLLLPFALLVGHSQAAVNPLLYCLLSKNFRRSVTDLIRHPTRAIRSRQQCKVSDLLAERFLFSGGKARSVLSNVLFLFVNAMKVRKSVIL